MNEPQIALFLGDPAFAALPFDKLLTFGKSRDLDLLVEDDGHSLVIGEPVRYVFRRLHRRQFYDFVERAESKPERHERAFCAGLVRVEGGRFSQPFRPEGVDEVGFLSSSWDELEAAGISLAEAWDIGQWIYAVSSLPFGSSPRLPLLPSSLLAWDALERPSAAPSRSESDDDSGAHKAA